MDIKFLKAYAAIDKENDYTLQVAVASDGSEDRSGEVIDPNGWDLENFKRNPVFLWAHQHRDLPIGKVNEIKLVDGKLIFKPQFAADIDEFSKKIWKMFKGGFLNAFSVGFRPLENMQGNKWPRVELLEISAVPVPANANALVMARELGIEDFFAKDMDTKPAPELIGEYIHVRVRNPELFVQDSFRTIDLSVEQGIKAVIGKLKTDPEGGTVVQKFLFHKDKWTLESAAKWAEEHKEFKAEVKNEEPAPPAAPPTEVPPAPAPAADPPSIAPAENKEGRIISTQNREKIKMACDAMKSAADALQELLSMSEPAKDNDGQGGAARSNGDIRIIRTALKQATKNIEAANRSMKVIIKN